MAWIILVAVVVACLGVRRCAHVLASPRARRAWFTSVVLSLVLSVVAFFVLVSPMAHEDPTVHLNAWHKDGGFKILGFLFYEALAITAASGVVGGAAMLRRAVVRARGERLT